MNRFTKKLLGYLPVSYLIGVIVVIGFLMFSLISDNSEEEVVMTSGEIYQALGILSLIVNFNFATFLSNAASN